MPSGYDDEPVGSGRVATIFAVAAMIAVGAPSAASAWPAGYAFPINAIAEKPPECVEPLARPS